MQLLIERITNLLCIKSIVTLALTATFVFLCVNGTVSADMFLTIFTVVIGFYFGTQAERKAHEKATGSKTEPVAGESTEVKA